MKERKKIRKSDKTGLYFILPSLIGVSIFILIPFIDVVLRSFQGVVSRNFVGFKNYIDVFSNTAFKLAASNTIKFVVVCIPLLLIISLSISVLIHRFTRNSEILKVSFLIPMAIPISAVVLVWKIFFNEQGILSGLLVHLEHNGIDWMNSKYAFWILVGSYIWKNLGYNIILWLVGISSISENIYECAKLDGASEWQCFTKITLPNIKPTLYTVSVLSLLNSFKVFREAYLIAGDYPHKSIYLLQHIFNNWFRKLAFGKMSAASVIMAIIIFLLIMILQKAWNKQEV
ncbi:carbohydrate ABC transporter permease [uncultured Clostridium sp.]|uniref:carbohydrate ABC transporter permease n=1 Tax=uncultured Clostridium sp. TaxID=59620 RepID=UPI0025D6A941|nr:sugar ABC transporter permease [uncultured Clostridium sp.]